MGVNHCVWGTCTSDSRDKEHMRDAKFYLFPKPDLQDNLNENIASAEIGFKHVEGIMHKQTFKIDEYYKKYRYYYVVCSKHFPGGKPTNQFPNPVPAEVSSQAEKATKRKAPSHGKANVCTKKKKQKKTKHFWWCWSSQNSCQSITE